MDNINTFNEYFYKIYKKNGYLDKYGGSVVSTTLFLFFFFIVLSYYFVMSKMDPIRQNWSQERCKPHVMPFAGMVNAPPNSDKFEFTQRNFAECTTIILGSITSYFLKPFYYISDLMLKLFGVIMESVNLIRSLLDFLRVQLRSIFEYLIARLMNVLIPLQRMLIKLKDTTKKATGLMVASLYTVYGTYLALKSFMGSFLTIIIICLVVLAAAIILLWILPFTWWIAALMTVFFLLISVPLIVIAVWTQETLDMGSRNVPGKPSCFDKYTKIKTKDGEIFIKDIKPGTVLDNGSIVTAIFKLALNNQSMYKLNNIIVSHSHKVFYESIGWIDVGDHPDAIKIDNYDKEFIYCINTNDKRINIGEYKFLDWDDLEPIDIIKLKNKNYLNNNSSLSDIHKFLESGLHGNTPITLEDNKVVKIKNIKVNDILKYDERVLGILRIDTENLTIKKYKIGNMSVIGGPNLHFNDNDLGNFNTLNLKGVIQSKPKYLYHLITDTGYFHINNYKIQDYNSAIENILDIHEKIQSLF